MWVACGSHVGRNPLPSRWLEGGLGVAWGGFGRPAFTIHNSSFIISLRGGLWWLFPCRRRSRFEVRGSKFRVHHKHPEYNSPPTPPSRWSGGTLVPLWHLPIPIAGPKGSLFNQPSLSKSLAYTLFAVKRIWAPYAERRGLKLDPVGRVPSLGGSANGRNQPLGLKALAIKWPVI
jgi:hypothetical protein